MLKSKEFWMGIVAGYLLLVFVPSLNFRSRMGK